MIPLFRFRYPSTPRRWNRFRLVRLTCRQITSNGSTKEGKGAVQSDERVIPTPNGEAISSIWQRLRPVTHAFRSYGRIQNKRPYATQVATSVIIYFCGDLSAQEIGGEAYSPARAVRTVVIGAICSIPAYNWSLVITYVAFPVLNDYRFMFLGRSFNYASKILSLATKVVVNQLVFTPVFNSYFFGMQALLSGNTWSQTWEHVKRTVPTSFINSWKLWPAVTAFNFTYIQPQFRAIFAGKSILL